MNQVVLTLTRTPPSRSIEADAEQRVAAIDLSDASPTREVLFLCSFLGILQLLDGYLTAVGVHHFGTEVEGNALLRIAMEAYGFIPTLVGAKLLALLVLILLYRLSPSVRWLPHALKGLSALYLLAAVIPWTIILWGKIL